MRTIVLTADDFRDVGGRRKYCGSIDPTGFPGDVEIAEGLGTVWFPRLRATGSIRALSGTGIRSAREIVACGNIFSAMGLRADDRITAEWGITAERISARWDVRAGGEIYSDSTIRAGGSVVAGGEIVVQRDIVVGMFAAGEMIWVGRDIRAGCGIIAARDIRCGGVLSAGGRIFAGVSPWHNQPDEDEITISCKRLERGEVCYGRYDDGDGMIVAHIPIPPGVAEAAEEERAGRTAVMREVATATRNPTIPVKNHQNHLIKSPNGAMNGDA